MIYSVFSWKNQRYTYYKAPGEDLGTRPKPRTKLPSGNNRGQQPEALMPVLPAGAKPVGTGTKAKGRLAVRSDQAADTHNRHFSMEGLSNALNGLGGLGALPSWLPDLHGKGTENPFRTHPITTVAIYVGSLIAIRRLIPPTINYVERLLIKRSR